MFVKKIFRFIKRHTKLIIIILIIGLIGFFVLRPKPEPPIDTITLKRTNLVDSLSVSGSITAKKIANLSPLSSGPLVFLGASVGDTVTAGQTIAVLDQRIVQKNLQGALIDYSKQRDAFDQTIFNNNGIAKPTDAVNDTMKRILQDNQYDLDKSVNSVELQDLAKQQSVLTTPIAGVLTRADAVTVGTTVSPSSVFTIIDPASLVFAMDVDEADIGKVSICQKISITLDAFPDKNSSLVVDRIDFVSHTTTNGGNAFTVEAKLPEGSVSNYRVGMNGNADIIIAEKNDVITIPTSSLLDSKYVYVKIGNSYEKRAVALGLQNDTDAEVTSGLQEGDVVVLQPSSVPTKKSALPFLHN